MYPAWLRGGEPYRPCQPPSVRMLAIRPLAQLRERAWVASVEGSQPAIVLACIREPAIGSTRPGRRRDETRDKSTVAKSCVKTNASTLVVARFPAGLVAVRLGA